MDALENAGRLPASDYRKSILYSTLSPCDMCSGAVLLYGIPMVVIGENQTFKGPEDYVRSRGVNVTVLYVDIRTYSEGGERMYRHACEAGVQFIKYSFENKPKVTDPDLKETIKNFAQLDGVFIINLDGEILSAGTYINTDASELEFPDGFGTKHRSLAALTKETNAIAVVVSETAGKVRVLKQGRISIKV